MKYCKVIYKGTISEHKKYYKDKECTIKHREDGPAVEYKNGHKEWWVNGRLHRKDGPAVINEDGKKRMVYKWISS